MCQEAVDVTILFVKDFDDNNKVRLVLIEDTYVRFAV